MGDVSLKGLNAPPTLQRYGITKYLASVYGLYSFVLVYIYCLFVVNSYLIRSYS